MVHRRRHDAVVPDRTIASQSVPWRPSVHDGTMLHDDARWCTVMHDGDDGDDGAQCMAIAIVHGGARCAAAACALWLAACARSVGEIM